jgi:hypothetical protein
VRLLVFFFIGFLETILSAAFYSLNTAVGNGAMNKLGICLQWFPMVQCTFKPRMLLFSVDKGAMNVPRYLQRRNENATMSATAQR